MSEIGRGEYFSKIRRYMRTHKNLTGAEYYAHFQRLWKKSNDCENCSEKVDCYEYQKVVTLPITDVRLMKSGSRVVEINFTDGKTCLVLLNRDGVSSLRTGDLREAQ